MGVVGLAEAEKNESGDALKTPSEDGGTAATKSTRSFVSTESDASVAHVPPSQESFTNGA